MGEIFPERVEIPPILHDGCRCKLCGDTGYRHFWQNGHNFAEECTCLEIRQAEELIRRSGVSPDMTFETFKAEKQFQRNMLGKARMFIDRGYGNGEWFYLSGQVGCGKTHVCTAIVRELLKQNVPCRYMMWKTAKSDCEHFGICGRIDKADKAESVIHGRLFKNPGGL